MRKLFQSRSLERCNATWYQYSVLLQKNRGRCSYFSSLSYKKEMYAEVLCLRHLSEKCYLVPWIYPRSSVRDTKQIDLGSIEEKLLRKRVSQRRRWMVLDVQRCGDYKICVTRRSNSYSKTRK